MNDFVRGISHKFQRGDGNRKGRLTEPFRSTMNSNLDQMNKKEMNEKWKMNEK